MTVKVYDDLVQGTPEWLQARAGLLTASTIGRLITPKTLKPASNDTARILMNTLLAERITGHIEPIPETRAMTRGTLLEPYARDLYAEKYGPVTETGFIVKEEPGYKLGYSPDGLVGDVGLLEIKSRMPHVQLRTLDTMSIPTANLAQLYTGLFVTGREWIDYVSFCPQMPVFIQRVTPDPEWFDVIEKVATAFETTATEYIEAFHAKTKDMPVAPDIDPFAEEEITF